jgi:hypothetical protein
MHGLSRTSSRLAVPTALSWRLSMACLACGVLAGCTGVGMWLYEDPRVILVDISPAADSGRRQLQFVLAGCNTNDYDLQLDSLTMLLVVAGEALQGVEDANSLVLPSRASVALPLRLQASAPDSTEGSTQLPFTVTARAKVLSPTGPRYITGSQSGMLTMTNGQPASWKLKGNPPGCHPGGSKLPPAAGRGTPIVSALPPPPPLPPPPSRPAYGK